MGSQVVNRYSTRGSFLAGRVPVGSVTRTQPGVMPGVVARAHWYSPAGVSATATSAVPPSAPPGTVTSHDPSAATVTATVRTGRPWLVSVYVATYRLSWA